MDLNSPAFLIYFFVVLFLILFIILYVTNFRKVKKKKYDGIVGLSYVVNKFKLDKRKINYKKEILYISIMNSFIIASVGTVVTSLDIVLFLQFGLGFVLLFALIYAMYEIYGRHLVKKLRRDDE